MNVIKEIQKLKKDLNAVILVHNYQLPEVQDIADYRGDSLGLSVAASKTKADVIVFCGVHFMAETAKIISPQKTILIPDKNAGCPMADMITIEQLRSLKQKHPNAKIICYVNSSAEVKAESDICCTSANAIAVAQNAFTDDDEIIFIPDRYLGSYTKAQTGRNIILTSGYCPTHAKILPEHVLAAKEKYPNSEILVHPECNSAVIKLSDQVLSTGGMEKYVKKSKSTRFIIGTEEGIIYRLKQDNPDLEFFPISNIAICPNMKLTNLAKVHASLKEKKFEVTLPNEIIKKAKKSIMAMLDYV
ncbi:MAG: quinolinate synthase NadA [Candidatus Omnitrophica bacterium]|nr:quinolinate synthase NadA [Candidatus Omnitrophota bacterium]